MKPYRVKAGIFALAAGFLCALTLCACGGGGSHPASGGESGEADTLTVEDGYSVPEAAFDEPFDENSPQSGESSADRPGNDGSGNGSVTSASPSAGNGEDPSDFSAGTAGESGDGSRDTMDGFSPWHK